MFFEKNLLKNLGYLKNYICLVSKNLEFIRRTLQQGELTKSGNSNQGIKKLQKYGLMTERLTRLRERTKFYRKGLDETFLSKQY